MFKHVTAIYWGACEERVKETFTRIYHFANLYLFSSDTDAIFDAADIADDIKDDEVSFCKIFSYVIDKIRKCLFNNNNNTINKYKIKINAHRHLCII